MRRPFSAGDPGRHARRRLGDPVDVGPFAQMPVRPVRRRRAWVDIASVFAVAVWVTTVPAVVRTWAITVAPRPVVVGSRRVRWSVPAFAAAGAIAAASGGRLVAVLLVWGGAVSLVLAHGLGRRGRPDPTVRWPLLGATLLLAAVSRPPGASAAPAAVALATAALVSVAVIAPGALHALAASVRFVARCAGTVASVLVLVPVGLVVVVAPWTVQRLVGWDPLWYPGGRSTSWVTLRRSIAARPRRGWHPDHALVQSSPRRRIQRVGMATLAVVVLGASLFAAGLVAPGYEPPDPPPAAAGAAWWRDEERASWEVYDRARFSQFVGAVLPDVRSSYVNIVDGHRVTWRSPACDCRRLRVWMFGGSTMFGVGQRDGDTIASQFSRLAWSDRRWAVDVVNFGVHGDVLWNEGRRLEVALASDAERPDLVVFYDGFNDLRTVELVNAQGGLGPVPLVGATDAYFFPNQQQWYRPIQQLMRAPFGVDAEIRPPRVATRSSEEVVGAAAAQYRVGFDHIVSLARAAGVDVVFTYQPSRASLDPGAPDAAAESSGRRDTERAFRAALPDGVVDLSHVMDAQRRPVYLDSAHTNEAGAGIVARALLDAVAPDLASVVARSG